MRTRSNFALAFAAAAMLSCGTGQSQPKSGTAPIAKVELPSSLTFEEFARRMERVARHGNFALRIDAETGLTQIYREDIKVFAALTDARQVVAGIFRTCSGSEYTYQQVERAAADARAVIVQAISTAA